MTRARPIAAIRRWRQRGAIAVETAFALPLLLGIGLLGTDLQRTGTERALVEQAAGSAALTLATQPELTKAGVDALAEVLMQGHDEHYQLVMLNVMQSGRVNWGLKRGSGGALCDQISDGRNFSGTLPEAKPAADQNSDDTDNSSLSMVVVALCRSTDDISLTAGLAMPAVLKVQSIYRASAFKIKLDEALTNESRASGLA